MSPQERERVRSGVRARAAHAFVLDDTWLLTVCALVLATAIPWFVNGIDVDFAAVSWGIFGVAAVYLAIAAHGSRADRTERLPPTLPLLQAIGVVLIGAVWWKAGGLENPVLLLVFVLPVVGAGLQSRSQAYVSAALSIVVVSVFALEQAPELRWYLAEHHRAGAWLAALYSDKAVGTALFPGFYAPPDYAVALLEVYAVALFACAVAADTFGGLVRKSAHDLVAARGEVERAEDLWLNLIESLSLPAALVEADTLRTVSHSRSLAEYFTDGAPIAPGADLFASVQFSHPEIIREMISSGCGAAPFIAVRVRGELRAAEVRVQLLARTDRPLALVIINDITEQFCMQAALDAAEYAALIVDANGKVLGFNRPALGLFSGLGRGVAAASLLKSGAERTHWWQPRLGGRRKLHVEIGARLYQVSCSSIALPGEEEPLSVVAIVPVAGIDTSRANPTEALRQNSGSLSLR